MTFTRPFLLGTVFFLTSLPCSGGCGMERGGINCRKGAAAGGRGPGVKCVGWGVCLGGCVCVLSGLT